MCVRFSVCVRHGSALRCTWFPRASYCVPRPKGGGALCKMVVQNGWCMILNKNNEQYGEICVLWVGWSMDFARWLGEFWVVRKVFEPIERNQWVCWSLQGKGLWRWVLYAKSLATRWLSGVSVNTTKFAWRGSYLVCKTWKLQGLFHGGAAIFSGTMAHDSEVLPQGRTVGRIG